MLPVLVYCNFSSAPSRAVLMAAKELGVAVKLKIIDLTAEEQMDPEFIKMNPLHLVPTIDDNGFHLSESRVIMTYFANTYAPDSFLYPKDPEERARVDLLLFMDAEYLVTAQCDYLYPQIFRNKGINPETKEAYEVVLKRLNGFLEENAYVAGPHRTLADISILSGLAILELKNYDLSIYPNIIAWVTKMKSEISCYAEINDKPLEEMREKLQLPPKLARK